jgi:hydrogenase expression/formation protein HypC
MCLGTIALLVETWEDGGARLGRLEGGAVVSLAFVPEARAGAYLLVHLGIPVEVLDADDAAVALALRQGPDDPGGLR